MCGLYSQIQLSKRLNGSHKNFTVHLLCKYIGILYTINPKACTDYYRLDDIEDSSDLRRGHPATHTVFGAASTINSANSLLVDVMNDVLQLNNPNCMKIVMEELHNLFIGQSWDLHWTQQFQCPSEVEYLEMISHSKP